MKNAFIPGARALRELGIVADGIHGGLQDAMLPRLRVLGHEEHRAAALFANLMHKLIEAGGVAEIDVGIRFDAVAISA